VAHDEEPEVGDAEGKKLTFDTDEESDVLFNGESANVAKNEGGIVKRARAMRGRKLFRVDATLHQVAGAMCRAFEHGTELVIRSVEHACERVEARGDKEGRVFDTLGDRGGRGRREAASKSVEAACGVLMHIGVPGSSERDLLLPCEEGTESAEFAGSRDVDDVGAKAEEFAANAGGVSEKERVEVEVLLDTDGSAGTAEFESAEFGDVFERQGARSCTNTEKGKVMSLGVGDEVAGGVCDAVDLVERVRKVSDARCGHGNYST
jgi:hypothetical protein